MAEKEYEKGKRKKEKMEKGKDALWPT